MRLVLQLIHISDLHFVTRQDQLAAKRAGVLSRVALLPWWAGGLMGHDHGALDQFEDALSYVLAERMLGTNRPPSDPTAAAAVKTASWIVCTGDLSTFGDRNRQVALAARWMSGIARRKGIQYCSIYGNHDVWDCAIPWDSSESALVTRRDELRSRHFQAMFPLAPIGPGTGSCAYGAAGGLSVPLPVSRRTLVVTSLNTVVHERVRNSLAYGEVTADRYWSQTNRGPDQLGELLARAKPDEVRIVLTHHPVHYPAAPMVGKRLLNADYVGKELSTRVGAVGGTTGAALATLVLSGHTHVTFPAMPGLPATLPAQFADIQVPLGTGQLQMVAGTLSQLALGKARRTHDFTCLRFYESDSGVLEIEREVWRRTRPGPSGPFRPISDGTGWVESLVLG